MCYFNNQEKELNLLPESIPVRWFYKTSEGFLNVSTGFKHVGLSIMKKKHFAFPDGLALLSTMISVNPQKTVIHPYH